MSIFNIVKVISVNLKWSDRLFQRLHLSLRSYKTRQYSEPRPVVTSLMSGYFFKPVQDSSLAS